jgi:eukaryotic-like serine/threonine-protein kinase
MAAPEPNRLGPYEIVSILGKGGMGEVWKAHDPRLGRDVAIKVSAQQFTDRFEREARAIAKLNHKNVCTLFDVGPNYLVMELIEGPTLAERIARGPLPLEEALRIARQIADALEAAHEKGIVHRDLKPANVKIRPDGSVKVLDFGLAKSSEEAELTPDSPTMMSVPGMILGTAGYMAPEQARGQKVDKRADIWAFGVVLYEMATGKRLFDGGTVSDVLAAILTREPDLALAPEKIRRLLQACLEKDPWKRLRDIGDVWRLLDAEQARAAPSQSRFSKTGWIAAGAFALVAATLAFVHFREQPPETPVVRSMIPLPDKTSLRFDTETFGLPALSADGRRLVFGAASEDGNARLWIRSLDSTTAQPLAGTEGLGTSYPFWSPDGRSIGFGAEGKLKKIDLSGGPGVTLIDAAAFRGASWSPQGVIVFAPNTLGPLQRIQAAGGSATPAAALDPARKENSHRFPWFLPDGRHFLYAATIFGQADETIYAASLDSREAHVVAQANSGAVYASGHLLYLRGSTLMAQPFDAKRLTTTGEAVPVAEQIAEGEGSWHGVFTVSTNGTLVVQTAVPASQALAWLDRTGKRIATVGEPGGVLWPSLSPDGKRATAVVSDRAAHNTDLWVYDLARNLRTRLTFDPAVVQGGIWSPDGTRIIFSSNRGGHFDLYRKSADGSGAEELLYADGLNKYPTSWSPDGKFVMYWASGDPKTGADIWVLPLEGERKPFPFLKTAFTEQGGPFSPDGRWIAYASDESGRPEIYVVPFPGPGGKRQVSTSGGGFPRWRKDGKELFYLAPDGRLMAAEIGIKAVEVEIGAVRPLSGPLQLDLQGFPYDVSADGQRFLAIVRNEQSAPEPLTLVQNWTSGLKK